MNLFTDEHDDVTRHVTNIKLTNAECGDLQDLCNAVVPTFSDLQKSLNDVQNGLFTPHNTVGERRGAVYAH